jgi:two-component system sensor histidine kinase YesM
MYFNTLVKKNHDDRLHNAQKILAQIASNMDNTIETLKRISWLLAENININNLVKYPQNDQSIIVQSLYHIKPLTNIIMHQNNHIDNIRIIHNNHSLFDIRDLLFYDYNIDDRINHIKDLTPDMRFPKTAIEYRSEGHHYPFKDSYQVDYNVWYIYTVIDQTSYKNNGFIELVISNSQLCQFIYDLPIDQNESISLVDYDGSIIYTTDNKNELESIRSAGNNMNDYINSNNNNKDWTYVTYDLQSVGVKLVYQLPNKMLHDMNGSYLYAIILVVITISSLVLLSYLLSRTVLNKMLLFTNEIEQMDHMHNIHLIKLQSSDEIGVMIVKFNQMINRLENSIKREQELNYIQLNSQLQPHLLCNIIDMLRIKAEKLEHKNFASALHQIEKYLSYLMLLEQKNVTLGNELDNTTNYIQLINQLRETPVLYSITLDSWTERHLTTIKVPKLFLQPIIENAFRHGLSKRLAGFISINIEHSENHLEITIEDNGIGITRSELQSLQKRLASSDIDDANESINMGLRIVKKKLDLHYPADYTFNITSHINAGTCVSIRLHITLY